VRQKRTKAEEEGEERVGVERVGDERVGVVDEAERED
jgi:hypothetical protein